AGALQIAPRETQLAQELQEERLRPPVAGPPRFPDAREQVLRGHAGGSAPILRHRQSEIDGGGARLAADLRSAIERLLEQDPAARELAALHPEHAQVDGGGERLVRLAELLVAVATFLIERVR